MSIVVPVFNESANLPSLWSRLKPVLDGLDRPWETVFIDDGSRDDSLGHPARNRGGRSGARAGGRAGAQLRTAFGDPRGLQTIARRHRRHARRRPAKSAGRNSAADRGDRRRQRRRRRMARGTPRPGVSAVRVASAQPADVDDRRRADARLRMHAARVSAAHRRYGGRMRREGGVRAGARQLIRQARRGDPGRPRRSRQRQIEVQSLFGWRSSVSI